MNYFTKLVSLLFLCVNLTVVAKEQADSEWIALFDGKTLNGWTPKFVGHDVGVNYKNTFRVTDGLLTANYDEYEKFNGEFGHLFYNTPYSHYILRATYRFVGEQVPVGPGMSWAYRNNGLMLHSQPPETMDLMQNFPTSIEVQLLGGNGQDERSTGNLCTPDSDVVIAEKLRTDHCIYSSSKTYHGDQWVNIEIEVRGDEVVKHKINGELVFEYSQPQLSGDSDKLLKIYQGKAMKSGYIAIQAETHPTQFKTIELKVLAE